METHETLMLTISRTYLAGDAKYSRCSIQKDEEEYVKMHTVDG